jgi:hypothetical protein
MSNAQAISLLGFTLAMPPVYHFQNSDSQSPLAVSIHNRIIYVDVGKWKEVEGELVPQQAKRNAPGPIAVPQPVTTKSD